MALTILTTPPTPCLEPLYSDVWFRLSSDISTANNFRYTFDTYEKATTASTWNFVDRAKLFPRPDGTGQYSPARILESFVSFDFDFFGSYFRPAINGIRDFKMVFGEEYDLSGRTFTSTTSNAGYVQYNFSSPIILNVSDTIKIDKANKSINSNYDGLQTILSALSTTSYVTDKPFGISQTNESGDCIYRLTIDNSLSFSGTGINFSRQFGQQNINIYDRYNVDVPRLGSPFTNTSVGYSQTTPFEPIRLQLEDSYFLTYYAAETKPAYALIATYNSQHISQGLYGIPFNLPNNINRFTFNCGAKGLNRIENNALNGNQPQNILSGVDHYDIYLIDSMGEPLGTSRTFQITCGNPLTKNSKTRIGFVNKAGGVDIINFNFLSRRTVNIEREFFTKNLAWNYENQDRGETILNISTQEEITANTGFLTEKEARLIEELNCSPECYIILDSNNSILPIVITTKAHPTKTRENSKFIQYSITYRYAFTQKYQRN